MRRLRMNLDKLLEMTRAAKVEWHARSWRKNEDGTMTQEGKPDYLPMDMGVVEDNPDSPVSVQLQALEDQVRGMIGSGKRLWVGRPGSEHDVAYLIRFDHGRPECVDGYAQLPSRMSVDDAEGWYEEQDTGDLPMADKKGWVSVGAEHFTFDVGTRGDVDEFYEKDLKKGPTREVGAS